jgi:hypothetical protein
MDNGPIRLRAGTADLGDAIIYCLSRFVTYFHIGDI